MAGQAVVRTAVAGGRSIRCGMSSLAEEAERSVAPCTLAFVPNDLHGNAESQLRPQVLGSSFFNRLSEVPSLSLNTLEAKLTTFSGSQSAPVNQLTNRSTCRRAAKKARAKAKKTAARRKKAKKKAISSPIDG